MYPKIIEIKSIDEEYFNKNKAERIGILHERFDKFYNETCTEEEKAKAIILLELQNYEFHRDVRFAKYFYGSKVLQSIMDVIRTLFPSKIFFWHLIIIFLFIYCLRYGINYLRPGDVYVIDLMEKLKSSNSILLIIYRFFFGK